MAHASLIGGHVLCHHWDDAAVTAIHLINRMPSGVMPLIRKATNVITTYPAYLCHFECHLSGIGDVLP
ncbi:unnamed protein product [Prunus armeniaca]